MKKSAVLANADPSNKSGGSVLQHRHPAVTNESSYLSAPHPSRALCGLRAEILFRSGEWHIELMEGFRVACDKGEGVVKFQQEKIFSCMQGCSHEDER